MADDKDDSSKTEEPTARRLQQAREKGQVASSKEIANWMMLAASALALFTLIPAFAQDIVETLAPFIGKPEQMVIDPDSLQDLSLHVLGRLALVVGLFGLLMMVAGIAGHFLQTGLLFSTESLMPKLSKISPLEGFKRIFSGKSMVEFLKGLAKLAIVGIVVYLITKPLMDRLDLYTEMDPVAQLVALQALLLKLFGGVLAILFLIAILDFVYQRISFRKSMMMTPEELKEEYKQTEGDPHIKNRLRQLRMEKSKRRMMAQVPEATVVITNPTHYAIALKYEHGQTTAPLLLAKGVDFMAQKIREKAKEHDIPIVENPPLARAIYDSIKVDEEISFEHYKAVAEIIGYVMRLKKKKF